MLYMRANETAMHQPKAVHYIATMYSMYLFQRSSVSPSLIKIQTVFSEVAMYIHMHVLSCLVLTLFPLALEIIATYSNRIIDLVSHTTYVVCVNFVHMWRNPQFKVDSE